MFRATVTRAAAILAAGFLLSACASDEGSTIVGPSTVTPATRGPGTSNAILRVRCESTGGRSKISVHGNNLATGAYRASVRSGGNTAMSDARSTVGDEVEFDFDSNTNDIAAGATAIAPSFVQAGRVEATLAAVGGQVIASSGASCS